MKRKILFLLILLGSIGLVVGIIKLANDRSPKQGVLKINADPAASVFLDNKQLGQTPYEDKVAEGEYEIKLVPQSTTQAVASWQGKVKISKNLLTYVNADMAESDFHSAIDVLWLEKISSPQSEVDIITDPDGAQVSFDGESKGVTPLTVNGVVPGDHAIAISSSGFVDRSVKVKTTAGYKLIVTIKLALSPTDMISPETSSSALLATPSATLSPTPTGKVKLKATPTPTVEPNETSDIIPTPTPAAGTGGETNPTKPYVTIKDTPTGYLNVRNNPSSSGTTIVGKVYPGEKYSILDNKNGWYEIKYDGTNTGWISGSYCTVVE